MPFSGEISGRTAVIIPIPMNEIEATTSTISAATKFAFGELEVEEERDDHEQR